MFNVMKAQTYQLLRNNGTYYTFLAGLGISAFACAMMIADGSFNREIEGSAWLFVVGSAMPMLLSMLSLAFVIMICGGDMGDKTINYELLMGKRRSFVYFGRALVSMVMSVLCCLVTMALPILAVSAVKGWGHTMTVSDVALRIGTMIFPILRLTAFFIFVIFLFRSKVGAMAFGYMMVCAEMILAMVLIGLYPDSVIMDQFSVHLIEKILLPTNVGLGFVDGKDVQVVKDVLEISAVRSAAISGLIGAAVFLLLGYAVFRKRDMN